MTKKLYYKDTNTTEFKAQILEVLESRKGWKLRLDKTYFYPEGGGQPADKGWINDIPVIDVREEGEDIIHYLSKKTNTGPANGRLNQRHRLHYMQQHTGQHIISAALWKVGKHKTISVHMGEAYTTIEIETPDISEDHVTEAENLANHIINQNLPIEIIITDPHNLHKFHLRKPAPVKENVRLVHIEGIDYVGCCGLHLEGSGEVGLVKSIGIEKIRGNTRISWKIGEGAYKDYETKTKILAQIRILLSTKEDTFIKKLQQFLKDFAQLNKKCNIIENRLVELIIQELIEKDSDQNNRGVTVIARVFNNEDHQLIKKIAKKLIVKKNTAFCLISKEEKKITWTIGCWEKINLPFQLISHELFGIIHGKGGGRHPLWQGIGLKPEEADRFLSAFKRFALDKISISKK